MHSTAGHSARTPVPRQLSAGPAARTRPAAPHALLGLQRVAGNAAVTRLLVQRSATLVVQREPGKSPAELDAEYLAAKNAQPPNWAEASRVLNAFNTADIEARVAPMGAAECSALLAAVDGWNHRVRAALLDNRYKAAVSASLWGDAAVHLNGFDNAGIDQRVKDLPDGQVWNLYQGALFAMSGVSQQRIIESLARVRKATVSATPGTDAIRLLVTMQAKGVDPAVGAPAALSAIGLTGKSPTPEPAPMEEKRLISMVGSAMAGAAAIAVEPLMLASGKLAHTLISARYAGLNGSTLIDPSIIRLVRFAATVMPQLTPGALNRLYQRLPEEILEQLKTRPDIVDFGKLQVYEIKSRESAPRAVPEMENYLELLAAFKIPGFGDFTPGSPSNPGAEGELTYPPGGRLIWCCPWPGGIVYDVAGQEDPHYSPERLRSDVRGGASSQFGVEAMLALGLVGAGLIALLPEAGAAGVAAAAVAVRQAAVSYATLIPILVKAAEQVGQPVPQLQIP